MIKTLKNNVFKIQVRQLLSKKIMLNKNEIKRFEEVFKKYPSIQAVYLFGSAVTGKTHPGSDIDIAVITEDKYLYQQKLSIISDLISNGFSKIDLVFIDNNDLILQYEAVRNNVLIFKTPEFDPGAEYSRIVRQYLDFQPYLSVQRKAYKRRILDGEG